MLSASTGLSTGELISGTLIVLAVLGFWAFAFYLDWRDGRDE